MEIGTQKSFNLIIDEFQEFFNINESVYSDMQNIWDQYRPWLQTSESAVDSDTT